MVKKTALDIWNSDYNRINKLQNYLSCGIIIIWGISAKTLISDELLKTIEICNKHKNIIYI